MTEENTTPEINPDDPKADEELNAVVEEIQETEAVLDEAKAKLDEIKSENPPYDPAQQAYYQVPPQQDQVPPQNPVEQPYYQTPPQYNQQAPYYPQQAITPKDHIAAGLLAIFLGSLGIHKFYLGYNTSGFIMLAVSVLAGIITCGIATSVMVVIGIIEGILYLTKTQGEFEQIYVFNKREWF